MIRKGGVKYLQPLRILVIQDLLFFNIGILHFILLYCNSQTLRGVCVGGCQGHTQRLSGLTLGSDSEPGSFLAVLQTLCGSPGGDSENRTGSAACLVTLPTVSGQHCMNFYKMKASVTLCQTSRKAPFPPLHLAKILHMWW